MPQIPDTKTYRRTLIYIPIIHTPEDLGSLAESVKSVSFRKSGRTAWKRKSDAVKKIWAEIELFIDNLDLPWDKTKIYQDGLPVCGREAQLVADLARSGSVNHRLVEKLIERGAVITGTESPDLLMKEYERAKSALSARRLRHDAKEAVDKVLLGLRDKFIAQRINETLESGETGIVFLGMLHSLDAWIEKDIRILHPFK